MKRPPRRQRGIAAIEMAVVLGLSVTLVTLTVLFGRLTWHATVIEKATQNVARTIAALPPEAIMDADADTILTALARQRVLDTTGAAGLDIQPRASVIDVECDGFGCGTSQPAEVTVKLTLVFEDTVFGSGSLRGLLGVDTLNINTTVTLSYVP